MSPQANILVVEDREDWQDIVCGTISAEGHLPYPALSYQEALDILDSQKIDLAVVDPVLDRTNRFNRDGLSVIQKISEVRPAMPIVVVTGSLTHDLKSSLQHLCPGTPVVAKESWDPLEFNILLLKLMGSRANSGPDGHGAAHWNAAGHAGFTASATGQGHRPSPGAAGRES